MAEQPSTEPTDEMKRKFREALDRKKQNEHDRPAHLDGDSVVHEAHGPAVTKREFRRKSV
jgi:membrane-associated protein